LLGYGSGVKSRVRGDGNVVFEVRQAITLFENNLPLVDYGRRSAGTCSGVPSGEDLIDPAVETLGVSAGKGCAMMAIAAKTATLRYSS
jgi:hypothetical protein